MAQINNEIKTLVQRPTNRDLLNLLSEMSEDQLNDNLTVWDAGQDEFHPVELIGRTTVTDVLDAGAMVCAIGAEYLIQNKS